jgi:hypothetical protein
MKTFIAKYMLYIYNNFIDEDWDMYRKWIVPFIKPAWFVRAIYIWIVSIVFFPLFYIGMIIDDKMEDIDAYVKMFT